MSWRSDIHFSTDATGEAHAFRDARLPGRIVVRGFLRSASDDELAALMEHAPCAVMTDEHALALAHEIIRACGGQPGKPAKEE